MWNDEMRAVINDTVQSALLDAHRAAWAEGKTLGRLVQTRITEDGRFELVWEVKE